MSRGGRGRQKIERLHKQGDHAGHHECCTPYQVEIEPGLAEDCGFHPTLVLRILDVLDSLCSVSMLWGILQYPLESSTGPDRIALYQKNIEAICSSEAEIRHEVRQTVLHEVGHYFGMNEDQP